MFGSIKAIFTALLTGLVNGSNHAKWGLLGIQKCMIRPTLINLHPNEYSQKLHCYPFAVKLDRCVRTCNTLNVLSNKVCVPNKTEVLSLRVFNMITRINELETLGRNISCKCKCKFDGRKCNPDQWWNIDKCWCECKKRHVCEKDYAWNPATSNCENGKYLAIIMDNSTITCDEIIESYNEDTEAKLNGKTKIIAKILMKRKQPVKHKIYILLVFLLINIAFLIVVSLFCFFTKYEAKRK